MIRAIFLLCFLAACDSVVMTPLPDPCGGACSATQRCVSRRCEDLPCLGACVGADTCDTATNTCVHHPCRDECTTGQRCGADNNCFYPCGKLCSTKEWCDESATPGVCRADSAPSAWGVIGDGKVQRVISLKLSDKTKSCDLDGDGALDNAFAGASSLIGSSFQDQVKKGQIFWLFENKVWLSDGLPFTINLLNGHLAAAVQHPDWADQEVTVDATSYDQPKCTPSDCPPVTQFIDATLSKGQLSGTATVLYLPVQISSLRLLLKVTGARLAGTVTNAKSWASTSNGRICGYVTESDLAGAIDALDPDLANQFGGKAALQSLIPTLLKSDIDSDGDGVRDAKSISLDFETFGAKVIGVTP